MTIESISAIKDCMSDIGIIENQERSRTVEAKLTNLKNYSYGNIHVEFNSNWHADDGPYIIFNDAIKSFGIQHTCFTPQYQTFEYDKNVKELKVSSGNGSYEFTLKF